MRPLCRQLLLTSPVATLPDRLPLVVECETGFHVRGRGEVLVPAMNDAEPRWGFETTVDDSVFPDRLARLARRFPPAAGATIADAWAGLQDMTADAHPIIGRALADEILIGRSSFDLAPYRLERFAGEVEFPEPLVL